MGLNIDETFIQIRMLNTGKGPAVHSLRAQADKHDYHRGNEKDFRRTTRFEYLFRREIVEIRGEKR